MKTLYRLMRSLLCGVALGLSGLAQIDSPPGVLDENTRLMQEYMARRAEWVEVRQAKQAKAKETGNPAAKQAQIDKLTRDEAQAREAVDGAARAYRQAVKAKRDQLADRKPRN